jgi:hypothetical protein
MEISKVKLTKEEWECLSETVKTLKAASEPLEVIREHVYQEVTTRPFIRLYTNQNHPLVELPLELEVLLDPFLPGVL